MSISNNPEALAAIETLGRIWESELRKQFNIPVDWTYRVGYTSEEAWNQLIDLLGDKMRVVSGSIRRKIKDRTLVHFSIFISPSGMEILETTKEKILAGNPS
jgi:hypothetical protein